MGFQTGWTEMMHWLEKSVRELEVLYVNSKTEEEDKRLFAKLQAMKMSLQKINEIEKQYGLCIHEHAVIDGDSARDVYCTKCHHRLHKNF